MSVEARIKEIEEREKAATKGPWEADETTVELMGDGIEWCELTGNAPQQRDTYFVQADAVFIAHARQDIPFLLAELKKAREALGWIADWGCSSDTSEGCEKECAKRALEVLEALGD